MAGASVEDVVCPDAWYEHDGLHFCYLPADHDEPMHVCVCGATAVKED